MTFLCMIANRNKMVAILFLTILVAMAPKSLELAT